MSETPVAFARLCLCVVETAIAFAGEKWVFLVHFPGAEVTPVSPVLCWGRAVVLLVSTSPRCRASFKSWACAQVVDGLFVRLLSRPLGVVRIRWGICRRGWCGCGIVGWRQGQVVRAARLEGGARPAGPGRASRRRAERSSRRGRRAGGQASRRTEVWRRGRTEVWRRGAARRSGGGRIWEVSAPRPRR